MKPGRILRSLAFAVLLLPSSAHAQDALASETLDERPLVDLTARVSRNSSRGTVLGASARTDRLFGNQRLSFDIEAGEDTLRYGLEWSAPELFGASPQFGLGLNLYRNEANKVFGFDSEAIQLRPELVWSLDPDRRLAVYALASQADIDGVSPTTSRLIRQDAGQRDLLAVGLDLSQRFAAGTTRLSVGGGLELGSTSRGHDFARVVLRADMMRQLRDGTLRFSTRMRAGSVIALSGTSNIGDRSMLGAASLRGFDYGGFGPRDLAVAQRPALGGNTFASLRFDLQAPRLFGEDVAITPGMFLDLGSLWGLDDTRGGLTGTDRVDDSARLRASVGFSAELATGRGPILLNLSHALEREDYDQTRPVSLTFATRF